MRTHELAFWALGWPRDNPRTGNVGGAPTLEFWFTMA